MRFDESLLEDAHRHSGCNQQEVLASSACGCFYCLEMYSPDEIEEWIDEIQEGRTAICPRCGIDSVLGDESGYPLTDEFLKTMYKYWF